MSIYSWETFVLVAEQKSFVRAAEILHVSQSAVSHIIRKLEEENHVILFIRNRNKAELTAAGQMILPLVRNLLECSRSLDQMLSDLEHVKKGEVRIAAFNSVSKLWFPELIQSFKKTYPDVSIKLLQTGDENISRLTENGEIDLAVMPSGYPFKGEYIPVHRTQMFCLSPEGYCPLNGRSVTAGDLEGQSIIMQVRGYDAEMQRWIAENKVNVKCDYRFEVDSTCHEYVRQGLGFFLASELMLRADPVEGVSAWPIEPACFREVGIVTVYPDYAPPVVKLFRQELFNYLEKNGIRNMGMIKK